MIQDFIIIAILSAVVLTIMFACISLCKTRKTKLDKDFQAYQQKKEAVIMERRIQISLKRLERIAIGNSIINQALNSVAQ